MDFKPHQLVNLLILGKDKEVLNSLTPWICASCESCEVRCPNGVPLSELMDRIRQRALKEKIYKGKGFSLPLIFLKEIKKRGRIHEISLILGLKRLVGFRVSMEELRMGFEDVFEGKVKDKAPKKGFI
jgi:heterodisulfide reductase subunit C